MRKRWLALQADCCTATGDWWRDRKNEWQAPEGDEADERVEALAQAVRQLVLDHHRGLQQDQLLDAIMSGMGHKLGGAFIDRHADMSASHLRSIEIEEEQREAREDERRRQALYAEMFD